MSNFTFKLNSTTTGTNDLQFADALALDSNSSAGPETMGANIATAQFTLDLNDWFSLVYADGENPVEDAADDVKYMFAASASKTIFAGDSSYSAGARGDDSAVTTEFGNLDANAMVNWDIQSSGADTSVDGYGWANRLPQFGVDGLDSTSAVTSNGNSGTLSLYESVLPKRIMAAYGADVTQLLANEADLVADVKHRLLEGIDAFLTAFAASDASKSGVGYKLWTQAVTAAAGENTTQSGNTNSLTNRLGSMISSADDSDVDADGDDATNGGFKKLGFTFMDDDVIELDLILTKPTANAEPEISVTPETGVAASRDELSLIYRIKLVHADA
tara:strand:+ start:109 stop:1101 length:993 start_codon:yes stop_codon:yes gene_type:complete